MSKENEQKQEIKKTEEKANSYTLPVMMSVIAVLLIIIGFFVLWIAKANREPEYAMPNLIGMSYWDAKAYYTYLDIQIGQSEYTDDAKDVIYFQDIEAGVTVSAGQPVHVDISLGAMEEVPDVTGYAYTDAQKLIEQLGFTAKIKYEASEEIPADQVIRTKPQANQQLEAGETVILYVSQEAETETVIHEMPDLIGMTLEDAQALCEEYGLIVTAVEASSAEEENSIIEQSIEEEEIVYPGDEITLTYSNGVLPTGIVNFELELPENASGRFVVDFMDSNGVIVGYSNTINAAMTGGTIDIAVEGSGEQQLAAILTNYATNQAAELGVYDFDFTELDYEEVREDIEEAFRKVGGILETGTEETGETDD